MNKKQQQTILLKEKLEHVHGGADISYSTSKDGYTVGAGLADVGRNYAVGDFSLMDNKSGVSLSSYTLCHKNYGLIPAGFGLNVPLISKPDSKLNFNLFRGNDASGPVYKAGIHYCF